MFDWTESCAAPDQETPRHRGFGTVVLEEMLAHNLNAETCIAFSPDGLRFRMVLPLSGRVLHAA